jgi:hypothetical protein
MSKVYIGIDNGVSGTIGIVSNDESFDVMFINTPVFSQQNYTKKKANINRIDTTALSNLLMPYKDSSFVLLERPMVNPGRFKATISAIRALEASQIVLETLKIPYQFVDSKEWQKAMLPSGLKGKELKSASMDIGCRLFPQFTNEIKKHKDADGLLMAEYARRQNF